MSPLAQLRAWEGDYVSGSDRSHDRKQSPDRFRVLQEQGIFLYPEDGSGATSDCQVMIVSAAIERNHPDWEEAIKRDIPVLSRSQELARRFGHKTGAAVAGTSGKSTTTAMLSHILVHGGMDPEVICGAELPLLKGTRGLGNARSGGSDILVAEVDESDDSILQVCPEHALLTNLGKDHKPMEKLICLFEGLCDRTRGDIIYSEEDERLKAMMSGRSNALSFGVSGQGDYALEVLLLSPWESFLSWKGKTFTLPVPGLFNARNAAAALALAERMGLDPWKSIKDLEHFRGVHRRMERLGSPRGITIVDDFAHNPDKVKSSLHHLCAHSSRCFIFFQPHGFEPFRFFYQELCDVFLSELRETDVLFIAPIYYAGGTALKDIQSKDLADSLCVSGLDARAPKDRSVFLEEVLAQAQSGDTIAVLGARDPTLSDLCRQILARLSS